MINFSLHAFVHEVQTAGCISFGDVRRLQRDILPDGIGSREEAQLLFTLEQTVARVEGGPARQGTERRRPLRSDLSMRAPGRAVRISSRRIPGCEPAFGSPGSVPLR